MAETTPERGTLTELQRSIRELFRIVVPGAYIVGLLSFLSAEHPLVMLISQTTLNQVLAVFFAGLVGYALRVHERWWPYCIWFERERKRLNDAIVTITTEDIGVDHVDLYKYFLETRALDLKDRVHYFSSFYYMLCELSMFSFIALVAVTICHLAECRPYKLDVIATLGKEVIDARSLILVAAILQIALLGGLGGIRGRIATYAAPVPVLLTAIALGWLVYARISDGKTDLVLAVLRDSRTYALGLATLVFATLGTKQWRAVVGEQIFLVRDRRKQLTEIAGAHRK